MFRAEALRDVGLFDDGFFLYFEEVELMHRMKAKGWTVRHVPQSRVVHIEGASTGGPAARAQPRTWYESRRRYFALTGGVLSLVTANAGRLAGRAVGLAKAPWAARRPATEFARAICCAPACGPRRRTVGPQLRPGATLPGSRRHGWQVDDCTSIDRRRGHRPQRGRTARGPACVRWNRPDWRWSMSI